MDDLFPASLDPRAIGFGVLPYIAPVFFAIYPDQAHVNRVAKWQRRVCNALGRTDMSLRLPEVLHISIAGCGRSKRLRQPLEQALQAAAAEFSFPSFDVVLDTGACFGKDGRAFVAVVDDASAAVIHRLRNALADAQKPFGLEGARARSVPHMTLGYADELPLRHFPSIRSGFGLLESIWLSAIWAITSICTWSVGRFRAGLHDVLRYMTLCVMVWP